MNGNQILLVENECEWQEILKLHIMRALPKTALSTATGFPQANDKLANENWQLVVTDIGLPPADSHVFGMQIVQCAHKLNIPCIVVSGAPAMTNQLVADAITKYNAHFFSKDHLESDPSRQNEFQQLIRELVGFTEITGNEREQLVVNPPVDFVIITPLKEEREHVLAQLLGNRKLPPTEQDIRVYYAASLGVQFPDGSQTQYSIIVLPLAKMGHLDAASATSDAIKRWLPRYVVLVGIAGGIANANVKLGDVLIADQVADFELQKIVEGDADIRWQVHNVDQRLLNAAHNFNGRNWPKVTAKRFDKQSPLVHIGPICTGNKVVADESLIMQFNEVWTKLIGVEMEAGGVANAVSQSVRQPGFFMVRGVSDLADGNKDSQNVYRWRNYACEIAAAWTIDFLRSGPIPPRTS